MLQILLFIHVVICVVLVALVLMQQGKGADMGAAFGSGASNTVFGSQGSANFFSRATGLAATLFFISSISLVYLVNTKTKHDSLSDLVEPANVQTTTATQADNADPTVPE